MPKIKVGKKRLIENKEKIVSNFIKDLQWDLRDSYNSFSCLNQKQRDFLEEKLYDLLVTIEEIK